MDYLPDVRFSDRRAFPRHRNSYITQSVDSLYYNRRRSGTDNIRVVPNGLDPIQILRDSFQRYIVQTPIESNTIAIRINYLENETDLVPKTMYIVKRSQSPSDRLQARMNYNDMQYPLLEDIENPENVFENDQLNQLITQLQGFHLILMITLCEVYNDNIENRERVPGDPRDYRPYTIPIRVLYRDVPEQWIERVRQDRSAEMELQMQLAQLALEEEQQTQQGDRLEQFTNPTEEGQQAILNNPFFTQNTFDDAAAQQTDNPDQLQLVNDDGILNMPLNSFVWPGMCQICLDSDPTESGGLCRVGCGVGHIFHCDCINGYRNTRTVYGWNNKCPVCRTDIDRYVNFPVSRNTELPTEFGRGKSKSNSEIKYLKSLI